MANANINQIFQQYLGRAASDYEMQGFEDAMSKGILDPIGLGLFLQGSSEYAQKQGPVQAQSLYQNLASLPGYDDSREVRRAQDSAIGRFAELGRPDSSGLSSSFAQIGADSAERHRNQTYGAAADYLTNAYGKSSGMNPYGNIYNQNVGAIRARGYAVEDRNFEAAQMGDYYNRAEKQNKENQWFGLAAFEQTRSLPQR